MQIKNNYAWFNREFWEWPDDDEKLLLVNDWVNDLETALPLVKNYNTAIQAGGACGIWPAKLATVFQNVYTFEPCLNNYLCLTENLALYPNVKHKRVALGSTHGKGHLTRADFEEKNAGAWYLTAGDMVNVITIDSLELNACDFICLDVEGAELSVLLGAKKTIDRFRPVIMLESKCLPHNPTNNDVFVFLQNEKYECAGRVHNDFIFVPLEND